MIRSFMICLAACTCGFLVAPLSFADDSHQNLLEKLESPSAKSQLAAMRELLLLGAKARFAEGHLQARLASKSEEVRNAAATALIRIGASNDKILKWLIRQPLHVRHTFVFEQAKHAKPDSAMILYMLRLAETAPIGSNPINAFAFFPDESEAQVGHLLLEHLMGDDRQIREQVREAFLKLGSISPELWNSIISASKSPFIDARTTATRLIARIAGKRAESVKELSRLTRDREPIVRIAAAEALAKIDKQSDLPAHVLIEIAADDDNSGDDQKKAIYAMSELGPRVKAAVPVLIKSLNTSDRWTAIACLEALDQLGVAKLPPLIEHLREVQKSNSEPFFRQHALDVILDAGPAAASAHDILLLGVDSTNEKERIASINGLAAIEVSDDATVKKLLGLLQGQPEPIRVAAARSVGKLAPDGNRPVARALSKMLFVDSHDVGLAACEGLIHVSPKTDDIGAALTALLQTGKATTTEAACGLIIDWKPHAAGTAPQLVKSLELEEFISAGFGGYSVTHRVLQALETIGAPAVPDLILALNHPKPAVRGLAAEALGNIGNDSKSAIPALVARLGDRQKRPWVSGCFAGESQVRTDVARALGRIGPSAASAIPNLTPLLKDDETLETVIEALGRIGPSAHGHLDAILATKDNGRTDLYVSITEAVYGIAPSHPQLLPRIRTFLTKIESSAAKDNMEWPNMNRVVDLIIKIRPVENASLLQQLKRISSDRRLNNDYQGEAAFALAHLTSERGFWKKRLAEIVKADLGYSLVESRLRELNEVANDVKSR